MIRKLLLTRNRENSDPSESITFLIRNYFIGNPVSKLLRFFGTALKKNSIIQNNCRF